MRFLKKIIALLPFYTSIMMHKRHINLLNIGTENISADIQYGLFSHVAML